MWKWLLEKVMHYIVGKDVFGQVQKLVVAVSADQSISGPEKREKVLAGLKGISGDFAAHMLNLAVEAAVALLKDRVK